MSPHRTDVFIETVIFPQYDEAGMIIVTAILQLREIAHKAVDLNS